MVKLEKDPWVRMSTEQAGAGVRGVQGAVQGGSLAWAPHWPHISPEM